MNNTQTRLKGYLAFYIEDGILSYAEMYGASKKALQTRLRGRGCIPQHILEKKDIQRIVDSLDSPKLDSGIERQWVINKYGHDITRHVYHMAVNNEIMFLYILG